MGGNFNFNHENYQNKTLNFLLFKSQKYSLLFGTNLENQKKISFLLLQLLASLISTAAI